LPSSPGGLLDGVDPLLPSSLTGTGPPKKDKSEDAVKGEDGADGTGDGGVVKANKGMILRKSVEYIRWVFGLECDQKGLQALISQSGISNNL